MNEHVCDICGQSTIQASDLLRCDDQSYCQDCVTDCLVTCYECNEYTPQESATEYDHADYCPECTEAFVECQQCDEKIPESEATEYRGDHYCTPCIEEHFFSCTECEEMIHNDDLRTLGDDCLCISCFDNVAVHCDDCGDYHHQDDTISDGDNTYCLSCFEDGYSICEDCNSIVPQETAIYTEYGSYCSDCRSSGSGEGIEDYSYKPEVQFYGDSTPGEYFGIENELTIDGDLSEPASTMNDHSSGLWYCKADDSIRGSGFELVSHAFTFDYMQRDSNGAFRTMFGLDAEIEPRNGLHIHVDRRTISPSTLCKILQFAHVNRDFMLTVSRRSADSFKAWARIGYDYNECASIAESGCGSGRGAINCAPHDTVEFRFPRSTLDPVSFFGSIELIRAMIHHSRKASDLVTIESLKRYMSNSSAYVNALHMIKRTESNRKQYCTSRVIHPPAGTYDVNRPVWQQPVSTALVVQPERS